MIIFTETKTLTQIIDNKTFIFDENWDTLEIDGVCYACDTFRKRGSGRVWVGVSEIDGEEIEIFVK